MNDTQVPFVGQVVTFKYDTRTGTATFEPGEIATITGVVNGYYVSAITANGRKVQTWASTFEEFTNKIH